MLERAKSSILPNENFREFFLWRGRGEFCVFKTGIPGGPADGDYHKTKSDHIITAICVSLVGLIHPYTRLYNTRAIPTTVDTRRCVLTGRDCNPGIPNPGIPGSRTDHIIL